jgi:hypothetical protein
VEVVVEGTESASASLLAETPQATALNSKTGNGETLAVVTTCLVFLFMTESEGVDEPA